MTPISVITFVRSADGVDPDELNRYLREDFTTAVRRTGAGRAMVAAVLNPVAEMNYRWGEPTNVDGHVWSSLVEFYFPDADSAAAAIADSIAPALSAAMHLIAESASIVVKDILMYDHLNVANPLKVFGFYRIVHDMTRKQSHDYWYGGHAQLGLDLKADLIIRKYIQAHTVDGFHCAQPRYDYDGASIVYFDTPEDAAKIYRNPEIMGVTGPDERNMGTDAANVVSIAAREEVVFDDRA